MATEPTVVTHPDLFILAAEPSADLHGSALLKELFDRNPQLQIEVIGGEKMRQWPVQLFYPSENLGHIGLRGVLTSGIRMLRLFLRLVKHIRTKNPKIVLLIDFPFFNIKLAAALRKKGYQGKIFQFICPKVWAHGEKRIETIASHFDELFTIFPFEKDLFKNHLGPTFDVSYVGNPLIAKYPQPRPLENQVKRIGIFPGSRNSELKKHIPILTQVIKEISQTHPNLEFCLFAATTPQAHLLKKKFPQCLVILPEQQYDMLHQIDLALAKCGTVTLELALLGIPTVIFYAISSFEKLWIQHILKLNMPYYSLPNILLNQEVYREIIGNKINPSSLAHELRALLLPQKVQTQREKLFSLHTLLSGRNASAALADLLYRRLASLC